LNPFRSFLKKQGIRKKLHKETQNVMQKRKKRENRKWFKKMKKSFFLFIKWWNHITEKTIT